MMEPAILMFEEAGSLNPSTVLSRGRQSLNRAVRDRRSSSYIVPRQLYTFDETVRREVIIAAVLRCQ